VNFHVLFLVAAMLLVGSNVGIGKAVVAVFPVPVFALLRFVIAVAVLAPAVRTRRLAAVTRGEWLNLFLQALFGTFGFTLLMLNGVARTSAVAAGVIAATIPAVATVLAWAFLGERPDARALTAVALAVVGVAAINLSQAGGLPGREQSLAGNLLVLGAVGCEAAYVVLSRRLTQTLAPLEICAYTHGIGLLLMLPVGVWATWTFDFRGVTLPLWALTVWYALSASLFSFWLWLKGIRHVPAQYAGVFAAVLPVAAAGYGIVFLGERLTRAHGLAFACVMAGVALASGKRGG
jgi:drug/metabolite transporter (DMT)-like permease